MRYSLPLILLAAALAAAGCNSPAQQEAVAATSTSGTSVPNNGLIPGTPAGDLGDWVREIRSGVAEARKLVKTDVAAAQKKTLDLYVTRQEYSEMYYGLEGRIKTNADLPQAIETAEERFHDVMKLLAAKKPSVEEVRTAMTALDKQQAIVGKLWKKSGAHLNRTAK
jgi:hypothetical protein